ncbi:MAG: Tat pathway signal sequence [Coriobacteriales bacterium]
MKKYGIPAILSIIIIAILYYATIPAMNIHSTGFWWFVIYCVIIVTVLFAIPRASDGVSGMILDIQDFFEDLGDTLKAGATRKTPEEKEAAKAQKEAAKAAKKAERDAGRARGKAGLLAAGGILAVCALALVVGGIISGPFFNAKAYSQLLDVQDGEFSEDIAEISMNSVPVVDRSTAVRLGSRTIGEMSDLVSQYAVDESSSAYTQISYKETPYRVSSLKYADIIKWITNTRNGLPGYVTVNMVTQETQLVRLPEGEYMHYSTAEHFNNYLYRHVRFQFPTKIFGEAAFEIDDSGHPYWIVPTVNYRIMLFGGKDYDGAILVDAVTGESAFYALADVPQWCDKVFSADLVYDQLGSYGKYRSGFWNSLIGQSGVLVPTGSSAPSLFSSSESSDSSSDPSTSSTSGYNYLAIDDDVYMYTGMTSANSDESLVGFVLVNLRTKATTYYTCAGATETSAMRSAEGQVQQMSYVATSPLLLNIADRPTYFLSLKDGAGLVKMYAFIDVQRYQIVGVGSTVDAAQTNYIAALGSDSEVDVDTSDLNIEGAEELTGTIDAIESVVKDGTTYYYFKMKGQDSIFVAAVGISYELPFMSAGEKIKVRYVEADGVCTVSAITEPGKDFETVAAPEPPAEEQLPAEGEEQPQEGQA